MSETTSPEPEKTDTAGFFIGVGFFGVLFGIIGYVLGLGAQQGEWQLPGARHPVYSESFSFDRLDDLERCVADLQDRLDTAKACQERWRHEARHLIKAEPSQGEEAWTITLRDTDP